MRKPFFDDDDDNDEVTTFEPQPWGARQRVVPRKTFKAAVSRIITLVPSLVRQVPPPIPARRAAPPPPQRAQAPAIAYAPTALAEPIFAQPAFAQPAFAQPAFAGPSLPTHIAAVGALAFAPRMSTAHIRKPVLRASALQRKIISGLAGGLVALIVVVVVQAMQGSAASPRTDAAASLATSLSTTTQPNDTYRMRRAARTEAAAVTVTPIETAEPTVPDVAPAIEKSEPAKRVAKKSRSKKPRRIVAGDTSTPLGNLRPRKM